MREDMNKVIVERPRIGHRNSYKEVRHSKKFNEMDLTRESMKKRYDSWDGRKEFNENLNPLWRWLDKQVGRSWNDVYSEIKRTFDCKKTINDHIMLHVNQQVTRSTYIDEDGNICDADMTYSWSHRVDGLYVNENGILQKTSKKKYRYRPPVNENVKIIENYYFERDEVKDKSNEGHVRRIWFVSDLVQQQRVSYNHPVIVNGIVQKDEEGNVVYRQYWYNKYNGTELSNNWVAINKQTASKAQLKEFGLTNS